MGRRQAEDLLRRRRHEDGHAQVARGAHGEPEILRHEVGHEARRVVAVGRRLADEPRHRVHVLHHPGVAGGLRDDVGENLRVNTESFGDPERLAHRHRGDARDQVVADLRDLARPHGPHVDDVGAKAREDWPRLLHVARVTPDHDRERAVLRAGHASGDGSVDEAHGAVPRRLGHPTGRGRVDRGHVHAEPAPSDPFEDPGRAQVGRLDVRR